MSSDRRKFLRLGMTVSLTYLVVQTQRSGKGTTADISPDGIRCFTEHVLEPGTSVEVVMRLPDRKEAVEFVGVVAWSEPKRAENPYGGKTEIGIRFTRISKQDRELLSHYGRLFGPA